MFEKVIENRQTDGQTDRESNYRGHSNPVDHQVEQANTELCQDLA